MVFCYADIMDSLEGLAHINKRRFNIHVRFEVPGLTQRRII
jgi:hypothetical protein